MRGMLTRNWGRVIFIPLSEAGLTLSSGCIHYGVTKTAVSGCREDSQI